MLRSRPQRRAAASSDWQTHLVIQMAICIAPASVLVATANFATASYLFFALYVTLLVRAALRKRPAEASVLSLGCLPALMLLREFVYYSSVQVFLGLTVLLWWMYAREDFQWMWRSFTVRAFTAFAIVYWTLSWAITADYSSNFRIFELLFTALNIRLLCRYRKFLATAFVGVAISGFCIGASLMGQGGRLGMVGEEGDHLGNPVTFGMPMALIVVLCLAEEGRWLLLKTAPWRRGLLAILAGGFLVFSTSRGSWSVALVCILFMLSFGKHRGAVLRFLVVAVIGVGIWSRFADTSTLEKYIDKTFNSEEEWSDINARVAQWHAFPRAFADAPIIGFGPGNGKEVSLQYSGHQLIWHSLYEHIVVECGSVGALLLLLLLGSRIRAGIAHLRHRKEAIPLMGILGFMTIAVSIPAIDGMAGLFLGLSLTAGHTLRYRVVRTTYAKQRTRFAPVASPITSLPTA